MIAPTTEQLLPVLRAITGAQALDYAAPPQPLTGGFWAELFVFRVTGAPTGWPDELVARIMPDAAVAAKETLIQTEVARLGFPTPVVRAAGGPDNGMGRAFMVMDRAKGAPLLAGLAGGAAFARLPRLYRSIPDELAAAMAALHGLDPGDVRSHLPSDLGVATTVDELIDGLAGAARQAGRADLAGAATWLATHPPASEPAVICHGDLHPFNLLVEPGGRVTVLDWSASLLAPRAYDVAFTSLLLAEPPLAVPAPLRPVLRSVGRLLARRFLRAYGDRTGTRVDRDVLRWHQGVVCLRALVQVAGWDEIARRAQRGHPWLVSGSSLAARLARLTGSSVRAR